MDDSKRSNIHKNQRNFRAFLYKLLKYLHYDKNGNPVDCHKSFFKFAFFNLTYALCLMPYACKALDILVLELIFPTYHCFLIKRHHLAS